MLLLLVVLFFVHLRSRFPLVVIVGAQQVVSELPRFFVGFLTIRRASGADLVEIVCRSQISGSLVREIVCQSQNNVKIARGIKLVE